MPKFGKQGCQLLFPFLLWCQPVQAEDLFELSLSQLKDIKVEVASLFQDDALNVASSTAVITRQDWEARGYHNLSYGLETVPSISSNTTWGGTEVHAIRGFASELSVRGIAYQIDDVPLGTFVYTNTSYMFPRAPLGLLDQVEMIRGPGSTLYGTDAFHGVISYKLREASFDRTSVSIHGGTPQQWGATINNSTHDESWQVHSGLSAHSESEHDLAFSYTDPFSGEMETSQREQGWDAASAFFKARHGTISGNGGQWQGTLIANRYQGTEFQGVGRQFFKGFDGVMDVESLSWAQQGDTSSNDSSILIGRLGHEVLLDNDLQLKQRAYLWQSQQEWSFDNSQYPQTLTTLSGTTLNCRENEADTAALTLESLYCPHTLYQQADESRYGYEIMLKQAENRFNTQWVMGAGYDVIAIDDSRIYRRDLSGEQIANTVNRYQGAEREIGYLLAQGRTGFFDNQLLLTYGLRWDNYSDVSDHASPRLGLVHRFTEQWSQKLMYGHAYRAPSAIELIGSGPVLGNQNVRPETIDTTEYALMYRGSKHQFEGVIFYSDWKDAIALIATNNATQQQYTNLNRNRSKGLELSFKGIFAGGKYQFNASYIDSDTNSEDINYKAFPAVLNSIGYQYPLANWSLGWWQRNQWDYKTTDSIAEQSSSKAYYRTDLYMQYAMNSHYKISFGVFNVFDRSNILPSYYASEGGLPDYGRYGFIRLQAQL